MHTVSSVDNRAVSQLRVSGRVDGVKEALLVKRILHLPVVVPSLLRAAELGRRRSVYNGVPLGAVLDRGAEIPLLYWSSTYFSWTLLPIARNGSKSRKKNPPINMIAPSTTPIIPPRPSHQYYHPANQPRPSEPLRSFPLAHTVPPGFCAFRAAVRPGFSCFYFTRE